MSEFLKANYHTHTWRCLHAGGTEREYVEAAIGMGIRKLGFSDHVPCPFDNGYRSRIRMTMDQAEDYVKTIRRLGEEYQGQIELFVGFEAEYIPEFYQKQMRMFRDLGCDYMIMGQHFLQDEQTGAYTGSRTRDELFFRAYVDSIVEGMKTGSYRYLAHPDLFRYVGSREIYKEHMRHLCQEMKKLDIPLEINLLGLASGCHYPCRDFWKIAGETGNKAIFGLDAHEVEHLTDRDAYERGLALAEKYHLTITDDIGL